MPISSYHMSPNSNIWEAHGRAMETYILYVNAWTRDTVWMKHGVGEDFGDPFDNSIPPHGDGNIHLL